jgi:hypothetical protein
MEHEIYSSPYFHELQATAIKLKDFKLELQTSNSEGHYRKQSLLQSTILDHGLFAAD